MAMELAASGILEELNIELLGTKLSAIDQAEDRDLFKQLMKELNQPIPESEIVNTVEEAVDFANKIGYPVIVRPAFTLGGTGGGMCENEEELRIVSENGLSLSPATQCLIERSIAGFKEIEYEVMRDSADNAIVVCNMENLTRWVSIQVILSYLPLVKHCLTMNIKCFVMLLFRLFEHLRSREAVMSNSLLIHIVLIIM